MRFSNDIYIYIHAYIHTRIRIYIDAFMPMATDFQITIDISSLPEPPRTAISFNYIHVDID